MPEYKLAARGPGCPPTLVAVKGPDRTILVGEGYCTVTAGPCAIESREEYLDIAQQLRDLGVHMLRGGLFKPRTSPYSFKGLGREGISIMAEARALTGLPLVTEILDVRDLDKIQDWVDVFQVGSRSMQNYVLLDELGKLKKPILLKRGLAATIEEWLLAAEYILAGGNPNVILCERGIRTFEPYTRNTIDIGGVALVKRLSHLPVLVDPSHATGRWDLVIPVAKAAIAAGADGIMVEVHQHPEQALSDGGQSLTPQNMLSLYQQLVPLARLENKMI